MSHIIEIPVFLAQRRMDLSALVAARAALAERIPWPALFIKAFALAARDMPPLRQAYMTFPFGHVYEYEASVASLAIERTHNGEAIAFGLPIRDPANLALSEIARRIREASETPIEKIAIFRLHLLVGRLPAFLRRLIWWVAYSYAPERGRFIGTFGLSVTTSLGAELIQPITAWTSLIGYGPMDETGCLDVRLTVDHRVMDGATAARALVRLEDVLRGEVLRELETLATSQTRTA